MTTQTRPAQTDISFVRLMVITITSRFLLDTGLQTFNPFLSLIAQGLGVDIVTLGRMLGVQSLAGLASPLLGSLAERWGYRLMMRLGLLAGGLGFLIIGSSRHLLAMLGGMILVGFCFASFLPTLIAYLSARLPYERRARGLGMLEYAWALAGIVGLYFVGQLIEATNWRVPFFVLGSGVLLMAGVYGLLPPARDQRPTATVPPSKPAHQRGWWSFFDLGPGARSTYAAMLAGTLNFIALMQINLSYGAWLSEQYGIDAAGLGTVALLLGCFDLAASVSVSLFTDRMGKRRSVLVGAGGALVGYLAMPWLNTSLISAVLVLAVTRGFAEFFIVSNLPLLSEQAPAQRAKVMTLNLAIMQLGFSVAGFGGPWLYRRYGVAGLSTVSLVALVVAMILMLAWVRERSELRVAVE